MKKKWLKFLEATLLSVLSLLTGCDDLPIHINNPMVEYGMPHADFVLQGTVTRAGGNRQPIPNIRVVRPYDPDNLLAPGDTVYTDEQGKFVIGFDDYEFFNNSTSKYRLNAEDIDGPENGGQFQSATVTGTFTRKNQTKKGDGWFLGRFEITRNIALEPESAPQPHSPQNPTKP
jgi:putative lipoprotein (rSAM/lipoprotein system)